MSRMLASRTLGTGRCSARRQAPRRDSISALTITVVPEKIRFAGIGSISTTQFTTVRPRLGAKGESSSICCASCGRSGGPVGRGELHIACRGLSEIQPHGELDDARPVRRTENQTKGSTVHVDNRVSASCAVEHVKEIGADLKVKSFTEACILEYAEVLALKSGTTDVWQKAWRRAKLHCVAVVGRQRWINEGGGVQVGCSVDGVQALQRHRLWDSRHDVGAHAAPVSISTAVNPRALFRDDGKRSAGSIDLDAGHRPAAHEVVEPPARIQPVLAAAEGQLIDPGKLEDLRIVECGNGLLCPSIVEVLAEVVNPEPPGGVIERGVTIR